MSDDDYAIQDSLSFGAGKPPGLLTNLRSASTGHDDEHADRLLAAGITRIPVMRQLEQLWLDGNPTPPLRPPGATEGDVHAQAVQNVQSQISASPVSQNPSGDGALIPGKFCASCGAQMVLTTGISSKTNKPYKRADCSVDKRNHPVEWLR